MERVRFYLDTSVLGAVFDVEDARRLEATETLLDRIRKKNYHGYISNLTIAEVDMAPAEVKSGLFKILENADFVILEENRESLELAESYLKEKIIPIKYRDDARHIAIGVVNDLDAIVSWNYRHMVNFANKVKINAVNTKLGYKIIDIITPYEVVGNE